MLDRWFHCPFLQMSNCHELLLLPWVPLRDCIPAKNLENQAFSDLYPNLRSISKQFQKMKCQRYFAAIALLALVLSHLLQTVRGSLLLRVTLGHLLVGGVAGSWYYNLFLHFLLSLSTKMLIFPWSLNLFFFQSSFCWKYVFVVDVIWACLVYLCNNMVSSILPS